MLSLYIVLKTQSLFLVNGACQGKYNYYYSSFSGLRVFQNHISAQNQKKEYKG